MAIGLDPEVLLPGRSKARTISATVEFIREQVANLIDARRLDQAVPIDALISQQRRVVRAYRVRCWTKPDHLTDRALAPSDGAGLREQDTINTQAPGGRETQIDQGTLVLHRFKMVIVASNQVSQVAARAMVG